LKNSKFCNKAIPLITTNNETSKYEVNPFALEILSEIPKPICVISVAGAYRSGKSFLINNCILQNPKGFEVGSTTNACTKGIWMWGQPLPALDDKGHKVHAIVIDSEGLSSLDRDSNHDNKIFTIALMLSSVFI